MKKIMKIMYIFILISFFKPDYFAGVGSKFNILYSGLNILSMILIFCIYLREIINNKKIPKIIIGIFTYCMICIVSTFINSYSNLGNVVFQMIKLFALCLIYDYGIRNDLKNILKSTNIIFSILVIINLITMILYPHGMWISPVTGYWENWFLGYDNNHITIFLPTLIFMYIYDRVYKKRLTFKFFIILFLINLSIIISWSATSVVAIFLVDIYILFEKILSKIFVKSKKIIVGYLVLFISIIILKVQNIFSFLIVDILKKDLTFSGRIYIWEYIKKFIVSKPLLGYGIQDSYTRYNMTALWKSYHAHNFVLEILYRGGILLLFNVIYIIRLVIKQINKSANELKSFSIFIIFLYAIILLTEFFDPIHYFYILIVFYNINYLYKERKTV